MSFGLKISFGRLINRGREINPETPVHSEKEDNPQKEPWTFITGDASISEDGTLSIIENPNGKWLYAYDCDGRCRGMQLRSFDRNNPEDNSIQHEGSALLLSK